MLTYLHLGTYDYIPKRPGPQTTSLKSIARREERERQAKANAIAAAARAAGIREGKDRQRPRFHEGSGSTPPSSADVSRKSSAAASRHTSPTFLATDLHQIDFSAELPMIHHSQSGLVLPYNFDPAWANPEFFNQPSTSPYPTGPAQAYGGVPLGASTVIPPAQDSCLYSSGTFSRTASSSGQMGLQASTPSTVANPSNWSGCLYEGQQTTHHNASGPSSIKSSSRGSSPRQPLMMLHHTQPLPQQFPPSVATNLARSNHPLQGQSTQAGHESFSVAWPPRPVHAESIPMEQTPFPTHQEQAPDSLAQWPYQNH